jgi:hypothetical protein
MSHSDRTLERYRNDGRVRKADGCESQEVQRLNSELFGMDQMREIIGGSVATER